MDTNPAAGDDPACQGGGGRRGSSWLPLYRILPHPLRPIRCNHMEFLSVQALQGSHTVFLLAFNSRCGVRQSGLLSWFCLSELSDLERHSAHLPTRELDELWLWLGQGRVSPLWEEGHVLNVSSVWPISKQPTQGTVCMLFWYYRARNGPVILTTLVALKGTVGIFRVTVIIVIKIFEIVCTPRPACCSVLHLFMTCMAGILEIRELWNVRAGKEYWLPMASLLILQAWK